MSKVGFLDANKVNRMKTNKSVAVQCSWLEDCQHSIEEPWGSLGEEEARGVEKQP